MVMQNKKGFREVSSLAGRVNIPRSGSINALPAKKQTKEGE